MAKALFEPEPIKPKPLFSGGGSDGSIGTGGTGGSAGSVTKVLFTNEPVSQKPHALFTNTPPVQSNNDPIGTFYRQHPLLVGKDEQFLTKVKTVDQSIKLDSSTVVLQFGYEIKQDISRIISEILDMNVKMVGVGIPDTMKIIVEKLCSLNAIIWSGKNRKAKLHDYIQAYQNTDKEISVVSAQLDTKVQTITKLAGDADAMFERNKNMVETIEAYTLAGKIIIERSEKALFDKPEQNLIDMFKQRAFGFSESENILHMNMVQIKNTQTSLIKMALDAMGIMERTYPLYKSSFSSMIGMWQAKGTAVLSSQFADILHDAEFVNITKSTDDIVEKLKNVIGIS